METASRISVILFATFLFSQKIFSQTNTYILNGSATQNSCNCYTLTPDQLTQSGSVWNANKINLNNPFDFSFNVFLGCKDSTGADGIVFILQPISTSVGTTGEGMGFEGISPSIGISLDTWQNINRNDPYYDHISIQANGVITHGNDLAGPIQASATNLNIEDCQWHVLRIAWDPVTHTLSTYFDQVFRLSTQVDLVATIFNNDPMVYWGFSGATGGASNLQQFCTALNPSFTTNATNNAVCGSTPITFTESSVSFAPIQSWYWNFGDGTTSTAQNPPAHIYSMPGVYQVKLVITGLDGCISDTLKKNITVGSKPVAKFEVFDTCSGNSPRITDLSTNTVGTINQWTWVLDGTTISNAQQPNFSNLSTGNHSLKLVVRSNIGCESDTISKTFSVKPVPVVDITVPDGCIDQLINFSAFQTDNQTMISQWNWDLGDGKTSGLQNPSHIYYSAGNMTVKLNALATNGCISADVTKTINVTSIFAKANNDTTVLPNIPFMLSVNYSGNFSGQPTVLWLPVTGLSDNLISNPVATLQDDMTYFVTVATAAGCKAKDTVNIKVFKGSAVYMPTGFTPNGDGKNDMLRALYVGIKKVDYFRVYNRWGQLVFHTSSLTGGWDGKVNGIIQETGTYIWMLRVEDFVGKIYQMKGTTVLIK